MIKIRRFIDRGLANELRCVVSEIYVDLSSAKEAGAEAFLADDDFASNFSSWRGVCLKSLPAYLATARPDLAPAWSALVNRVHTEAMKTFGTQWRLLPDRSWLRRHVGIAAKVPWHVDADAAAIVGFAEECFNIWLPLDEVGRDLPSLDVVPRSHKAMRKIPLLTGSERYRDDAFVSAIGRPYTPILRPGNALVFDQYTLHRTQQIGSAQSVRTACEFRFIS
jgi:hypothetical protein